MKIESAQHLWAIRSAIEALAHERVPFGIMLKLRRWRNEINEVHEALQQDLAPAIPEGGISPGDDGWEDFVETAEEAFSGPHEVSGLSPFTLDELRPLTERKDFSFPASLFEVLVFAGIVRE